MTRQRFALQTAAFALSFVLLSASAWADVNATVYEVTGNWYAAGPSSITGANSSDPGYILNQFAFTSQNVDFSTQSGTLADFLNSGSASYSYAGSYLGEDMSNCQSGGPNGVLIVDSKNCYSTVIEITGTGTFVGNTTYGISHDDGVILCVNDATCSSPVINSATPTSDIDTTWTPSTTETAPFTIWYMATNGDPEDLILSPNVATPEAGAISLLVTMLIGVAGFAGIFKKKLA